MEPLLRKEEISHDKPRVWGRWAYFPSSRTKESSNGDSVMCVTFLRDKLGSRGSRILPCDLHNGKAPVPGEVCQGRGVFSDILTSDA